MTIEESNEQFTGKDKNPLRSTTASARTTRTGPSSIGTTSAASVLSVRETEMSQTVPCPVCGASNEMHNEGPLPQ